MQDVIRKSDSVALLLVCCMIYCKGICVSWMQINSVTYLLSFVEQFIVSGVTSSSNDGMSAGQIRDVSILPEKPL